MEKNPTACHGAASTDQDTKKPSLAYEKREFMGGQGGETQILKLCNTREITANSDSINAVSGIFFFFFF